MFGSSAYLVVLSLSLSLLLLLQRQLDGQVDRQTDRQTERERDRLVGNGCNSGVETDRAQEKIDEQLAPARGIFHFVHDS